MVKTKSGNSSAFEQEMPVRLEQRLLDECVSHVKYQMLVSNVFGDKGFRSVIFIELPQYMHVVEARTERFPFIITAKKWSFCTKHLICTERLLYTSGLFQLPCSFWQHSSGRGQDLLVQTFAIQQMWAGIIDSLKLHGVSHHSGWPALEYHCWTERNYEYFKEHSLLYDLRDPSHKFLPKEIDRYYVIFLCPLYPTQLYNPLLNALLLWIIYIFILWSM